MPVVLVNQCMVTSAASSTGTYVADPTQLPVENMQTPRIAAYDALNVPNMAAGTRYYDPLTNVAVWKVTSAGTPEANTSAGSGYAEYGPYASRAWGVNKDKHTIVFGDSANFWLVDFQRGVGLSNYRQLTGSLVPEGSGTGVAFSNVVGQEQILYLQASNSGDLKKVDTAPATPTEVVSGNFPKTGFGSVFIAAQMMPDGTDTWFVGGNSAAGGTMHAWNSLTNQYLARTPTPACNDTRVLRGNGNLAYVQHNDGKYSVWDLNADALRGPYAFNTFGSHPAAMRKFIAAGFADAAPYPFQYADPSTDPPTVVYVSGNGSFSHHNGAWIQTDTETGGDITAQWMLGDNDYNAYVSTDHFQLAVGYVKFSNADKRILCQHFSTDVTYAGRPFASQSPDGKIALFTSRMNLNSPPGRNDLFVVEVPLRLL